MICKNSSFRQSLLLLLLFSSSTLAIINSVANLYSALQTSSNKNVGFLASTNYITVQNVLPANVVPVIYDGKLTQADMEQDVQNGKLFAAYLSGDVPSRTFNYFSSRIISEQTMLTLNTPLLLRVMNAAVSQALATGLPQTAIRNYAGKPLTEIHTCSIAQPVAATASAPAVPAAFPWPTITELNTANETWWRHQSIKIGTPYVNYGWFFNAKVQPTTGFYSDYFDAVNSLIKQQYQPSIPQFQGMVRVIDSAQTTSGKILATLAKQDGTIDATDMFFYLDVGYSGTIGTTTYTNVGRNIAFQPTCAWFGGDGTFFTIDPASIASPALSQGAIAGIVIGCIALVAITIFTAVVIYRERSGRPMFMRLIDQDELERERENKRGAGVSYYAQSSEAAEAGARAGQEDDRMPPQQMSGVALTGVGVRGNTSLQ